MCCGLLRDRSRYIQVAPAIFPLTHFSVDRRRVNARREMLRLRSACSFMFVA